MKRQFLSIPALVFAVMFTGSLSAQSMEDLIRQAAQGAGQGQSGNTSMDTAVLGKAMRDLAAAFGTPAELPDQYQFDLVLDIETTTDGKDPVPMSMMYRKDGQQLGIRTPTEKGINTVVIDNEHDLNVIFSEDKKGKKTVMAMPNMASSIGNYGIKTGHQQISGKTEDMSWKKTGKTKTVAGYTCQEYHAENDEYDALVYITNELGVSWLEATSASFSEMLSDPAMAQYSGVEGTMMETRSTEKKSGKVSTWVTKEVHRNGATIKTGEYEAASMR